MVANVSVGALFLAGIILGVLMAVLMMLSVAYFAHRNGWGSAGFIAGRCISAILAQPRRALHQVGSSMALPSGRVLERGCAVVALVAAMALFFCVQRRLGLEL